MGNAPQSYSGDPERSPQRLSQDGEEVDFPFPAEFAMKYEVIKRIGKGTFGSVYKVRDLKTKTLYAAKQVDFNESNQKEVKITIQHLSSPVLFSLARPLLQKKGSRAIGYNILSVVRL